MKSIIRYIDNLYTSMLMNKSLKKLVIQIPIVIILCFGSWLFGYKTRDSKIIKMSSEITSLKRLNQEQNNIINSQELDLVEYNLMLEDGDYYRYIAYKQSDINVPKHMDPENLKLIHEKSREFQIPAKYIYRLVWKESRYKNTAKSNVGASGYMQVMPQTFRRNKALYEAKYGDINHLDMGKQNILVGTFLLNKLHKKYKRWDLTFAAYNAGTGKVESAGNKVPNIPETKHYVAFIMND